METSVPTAARPWPLLLGAILLGCGSAPVATTSADTSTVGSETTDATTSESTTAGADEASEGSSGCADGMVGCPCTPEGTCEAGGACQDGQCVPLVDGCGDGIVDPGETCDDGNLDDADGCNADCQPSGSLRWEQLHEAPGVDDSCASAVAIDSQDAIVVVGYQTRYDIGAGLVLWLTKLVPDGETAWSDSSLLQARGTAVAIDPPGDRVVVTAYLTIIGVWSGIFDSDGMEVATVMPDAISYPSAVMVTTEDEIVIAGGSTLQAYVDGSSWSMELPGRAQALVARPDGGFVVAGSQSDPFADAWAGSYEGRDEPGWSHLNDAIPYDDAVRDVALDGAGNVVLAGYAVQGGSRDAWLRKLAPDGQPLWTRSYHSGETLGDEAFGVATDSHDRIVVVGYRGRLGSSSGTEDLWIHKTDPDGEPLWTMERAGPADDGDIAYDVAIDSTDDIVVVGCLGLGGYDNQGWIAKYAP